MTTGDNFTAYEIINTYKTLLYASDAAVSTIPNEGITSTLKTIRSADGSFSPLQLSSSFVNINGPSTLKLNGTTLTATASQINALVSSSGTVQNIRVSSTSGLIATQEGVVVSVINTSATLIVNPNLSVTNLFATTNVSVGGAVNGNTASFTSIVSIGTLVASNITYPVSDGTTGQIIITNGSGTLSFTDTSPGGGLFKGDNGTTGDASTGAGDIFRINEQELNVNVSITAAENASAVGPLSLASGVVLTVLGNLTII
tara:strand:- start:186 stop:959 length:774 start_codon:yes stop_codon:yes gene_type:complete